MKTPKSTAHMFCSCTSQNVATEIEPTHWTQLWHVGLRFLTFSSTCRAAALQLHAILAKNLVLYHDIGEAVNAIVTAADFSGPIILCDSSVFLMSHLLHAGITEVPGASLRASHHVLRWLFARWNPGMDSRIPVQPEDILALLRTCLGLHRFDIPGVTAMPCGFTAQAWQNHLDTQDVIRYLLLLSPSQKRPKPCFACPNSSKSSKLTFISNTAHFQSVRKLLLELLQPKSSGILQSWRSFVSDRSGPVSADTFRNDIYSCITILLSMAHFSGVSSPELHNLEEDAKSLAKEIVRFLGDEAGRDPKGAETLTEVFLQSIQPFLPPCGASEFLQLSELESHLLDFFVIIAEDVDTFRGVPTQASSGPNDDLMDLDDFGSSQSSRKEGPKTVLQRKQFALDRGPASYYLVITGRLKLLAAMQSAPEVKGFVPSSFVDQLVDLSDEDFLSSRRLIHELLFSDLLLESSDAARVVEYIAVIITSDGLDRCEPALGLCLDILEGLVDLWSIEDGSAVSDAALQCYRWFITAALGNDIVSPGVQKDMANLLLLLLRAKPDYGTTNSLSSPRSSLFTLLQKSSASVKFHIGTELPQIFNLFLLKDHDEIFVDVLENLPQNTDWIEGIHFRLFVFSKLASSWPTLLRRCMYHLFEAPGRIPECIKHAARCLEVVSIALKVDGPRELFTLFASQLLYTWLEAGEIRDIPFQVFGFPSLQELVTHAQEEIVGLMIMRGQDEAVEEVAKILRADEGEILQRCFTKIIAYSIAHDVSTPPPSTGKKPISGEVRLKKRLGELFFQCVNQHFADIVGVLFNTIDPESNVEKYLMRKEGTQYAAKIMGEIKSLNSSDVMLPPTQQPTFKAKYLVAEINHLCTRTPHEPSSLYTPALFTSVARRLLNTIHPALGSLHACSVLRKLRILISLAGSSAIVGYPLEMLLQAVQPFITNPECTDDAIGIIQYLLSRGSVSLLQRPTFVAGIALSILGSLRTFLDSTRSSTTQESQYKNTMSKARAFRAWVGEHLNHYNSPALRSQQRPDFHMLMKSALRTESIGNADTETPESHLLLQLLKDEKAGGSLLSRPARKLALSMLCSEFQAPGSFRTDILGNDELSIANAAVVWKSCRGASASKKYLSWAAKVLGRAFVASGHVHEELLQESRLTQMKELSPPSEEKVDSRVCVLNLLQELTLEDEPRTVGLAETALRVIVSSSDDSLLSTCYNSLSDPLSIASQWNPYEIPPSDLVSLERGQELDRSPLDENSILQEHWLRNLSIFLAQSVPDDILLAALVPILQKVSGFADQAFPFIIHLVLSAPSQGHRKALSSAFSNWFNKSEEIERNNLKMLLNAILYLRTQPLPDEKSSADRSRWLDLDYLKASIAAAQCGMFKTALLFVEESCSQSTKSSRRSSAVRDIDQAEIPTELLLTIFQNIDDPDMYYGVQQNASLSTILARFEYEKDGSKTLAFRGAQYDSHVRRQNPESTQDAQLLVKALDVLSLSGLSNSLLQAQQTVGMTPESLESMFRTARKLEQWDLPVPATSSSNSVTIYKTFQAIHTALEPATILQAVNDGLEQTMSSLVQEDLSASALHDSLQTLAALVEMDEVLSSRGSEQFEDVLSRFKARSRWMKIGR
jgi:ataxia telangiectasia mutated family protein